jgi:hypothetical protein
MELLLIMIVGFLMLFGPIIWPEEAKKARYSPKEEDPSVEAGLRDEHGNLTIKGLAFLDGLDGRFDGRFDGPKWP